MKRTLCSFRQILIVWQKTVFLFEKMKSWSSNSSRVYYHFLKFTLVLLITANKSLGGNFFNLFYSLVINKIQKTSNNKKDLDARV